MILIVDSNVVFAALLRDSTVRELLIDSPFTLFAPEMMLNEIRKYESEIIKRAGYTKDEFEILFALITGNIEIVEKEKYAHKLKEADELIGHIDKGDVPFLALALTTPNDGIWTENVKHFKQDKVKVWTTKELLNARKNQ
ncbi:PIN domain-containing protein [Candidatus Woesearchaeota archaeon]|nr:MAG: PIN domain-containing protein [Candidatus Woesearchaeota archaeon]